MSGYNYNGQGTPSAAWTDHINKINALIAANPVQRYTPPATPVSTVNLMGAPDIAGQIIDQQSQQGEGGGNAGMEGGGTPAGGGKSGGGGGGSFEGFPNISTLASHFDVNPMAMRGGMTALGMLSGPIGMGLSAMNSIGNVANTATNVGMLNDLSVNPGISSIAGGLLGFNGLSGNNTAALNAAMANQYSGFANLSGPQVPGDVSGTSYAGEMQDIAEQMDQAAANQNAASSSGAYAGQGPGQATQGDVESDALFQNGGYTGAGRDGIVQPSRRAGIVHEGEIVLSHPMVRRMGLLG